MKMFCKANIAVGATVWAFFAHATDFSSWFQLATDDVNVYEGACWADPADESGAKVAVSSEGRYYVPAGMTAKTPSETSTFPGESLAVAGTLKLARYAATHTINDLRLLPGSVLTTVGTYNYLAGNVDIAGTEEAPVTMNMFHYGMKNHFEYRSNFTGGPDSVVRTASTSVNVTLENMLACYLGITGSWANYFGKWIIGSNTCVKLCKDAVVIPGEISVEGNGMLTINNVYVPSAITVGSLTLSDDAMVYVPLRGGITPVITMTNSFSISGSPVFVVDRDISADNSIAALKLSGAAAKNAPDVSDLRLGTIDIDFGDLKDKARAEVHDNGDGTKSVRFVWDGLVQMLTSNSSYKPEESAFNATATAYWSTGEIPDSSFSGDVYCGRRSLQWCSWRHFSYPGMTLYTRGNVYAHVHSLDLKAIIVLGDINICTYSGPDVTELKAPLKLNGSRVGISGRNSHKIILSGEISGPGALVIRWDGAANNHNFGAEITGINTGFSGGVHVDTAVSNYDAANGVDMAIRLKIRDAHNLGGVYSGEDPWKAFHVDGYSYVECSGDIVLSEPSRGLFVDYGSRFFVASGKTLQIDYPMTYGGEFVKLGAGDLVLGCAAPGFATNGVPCELPLEGTNVLTIAEGSLRIAATNAVNGLAVNFAAGAELVVDPCPDDSDLRKYGAINTKWSVPFTGGTADGSIPVTFLPRTFPDEAFSCAICTVSASAAEALKLDAPDRVQKRGCSVSTRQNEDGTVTFVANISAKVGLEIIIR